MEFAVYTISVKGFFRQYYEIHLDNELVYTVKKPSFFSLSEYIFYDIYENEALRIKKRFTLFTSVFDFFSDGRSIATFKKSGMENYFDSDGIHGRHSVHGNFFSSEFTVFDEEGEIAKVSRKRFRSKNKYGVAIIKGNDELYILAMIISISMVLARKKKKA